MGHRTNLFRRVLIATGLILLDACILADDYFINSTTPGSPTEPGPARLLYGESHGISWTDLAVDDRLTPLLTEKDMNVVGLDYHYSKGLMFYSAQGIIWRLPFNILGAVGSPEVLVPNVEGVTSLAVDWIRDRIYWITPKVGTIERVNLDGSQRELVLNLTDSVKLSNLNNIAIDPHSRFLFLAVDGNRFIRSNINGGSVAFVQPEALKDKRVVSLAIDRVQRRLYVSSRHDYVPHVTSCGYDGSYSLDYDLSNAWWHSFLSIDVFGNQLFWVHTGWQERDTVWKANMSSNGSLSWEWEYIAPDSILGGPRKIWNLKVYHSEVQMTKQKKYVAVEADRNLQDSTVVNKTLSTGVHSSSSCTCSHTLFILVTCIVIMYNILQNNYQI